jgi:hypothetical protein
MNASLSSISTRKLVCTLIIVVAASQVAGRILSVSRLVDPDTSWPDRRPTGTPTHGDNDRSRWDTIRALVDNGTYAIGDRDPSRASADNKYGDQGIITEDGWKTIDKVLNPADHKFYSSKPPFLPTLFAGEYWLLRHTLGWSINEDRWLVMRIILLTVNLIPFVIFLILLSLLAAELGTTDWGRIFVVASACFATLMIPFATTFNNHTIAACSALFALYPVLKSSSSILDSPRSSSFDPPASFLLAGFFASFTACSELPATSFLVFLFLILFWRDWRKALTYFLPAAAIPIAFFFLTNYWAIGQWTPAYGEFGGPWYEYEGSHWKAQPGVERHGIDFAYNYESKPAYAFHLLLGHHGLFSLTPIFLLGLAGCLAAICSPSRRREPSRTSESSPIGPAAPTHGFPKMIAVLTLSLMVVVIGFYIIKTGNYGGWTAGPRWLIWLTPFLLLTMLPALDWLAPRRWGRVLACMFLAISVISASYPAWNPWRHPWLYNWMEKLDWIRY